jgi:hypothetical protein
LRKGVHALRHNDFHTHALHCFRLALCSCLTGLTFTAPAGTPGTVLFADAFTDPEQTAGRLDFDRTVWQVADGVLTQTSNAAGLCANSAVKGSDKWTDYEVEFDLQRLEPVPRTAEPTQDHHCGIVVRGNIYIYTRDESLHFVGHGDGGVVTGLDLPEGTWHSFRVRCQGSRLQVEVDGTARIDVRDLPVQPGGVALKVWQMKAAYRNLKVFSLTNTAAPAAAPTRNLTANSSFEVCTVPGLPDYWGTPAWGINQNRWITDMAAWRTHWGIDAATAFHGRQSLRIHNPDQGPADDGLELWSCVQDVQAKRRYTASAYLKADPPGLAVSFGAVAGDRTQIAVAGTWTRYSVPFVPAEAAVYDRIMAVQPLGQGTVWVDAVQLEEGETATAYCPSRQDAALSALAAGEPPTEQTPVWVAALVAEPPTIDGKLDDPCWRSAAMHPLRLTNGDAPTEATEAWLAYGGKGLYLAARCRQESRPECRVKARDGNVWTDPALEIFIASTPEGSPYHHLACNADGVQYDAVIHDVAWNGHWTVATQTQAGSWTAEIFLPFSDFEITKLTGGTWRFNLCRENHARQEYSAWSPTYGSFHQPDRFGRLVLDRTVFMPYAERTEAQARQESQPGTLLADALQVRTQYSYYSEEAEAHLCLRLSGDAVAFRQDKLAVELLTQGGRLLLARQRPRVAPEMTVALPIADLPAGDYTVRCRLTDEAGAARGEATTELVKREARAGEVKIDRQRRALVVDGKPFFPLAMLFEGVLSEAALAHLAHEGFTTVLLPFRDETRMAASLDAAAAHGLRVIAWFGLPLEAGAEQDKARALIRKFAAHPAVLAWLVLDEPVANGLPPQPLFEFLREAQALDPWHPVYMNDNQWGLSRLRSAGLGFPGAIVSIDYYPYPPNGNVPITAEYVRQMAEMGVAGGGQPAWAILLSGGYAFWASREPTAAEEEFMTYAAVINGATGVMYFASQPRSAPLWERIKTMNRELQELTPVLFSTEPAPRVRAASTSVQSLVRRCGNKAYLLAVNASEQAVTASFDLSDAELARRRPRARVLFESRAVPIRQGLLEDSFAGYQRHVYEFDLR